MLSGDSAAVCRLRSQLQRISPYVRTALIRGETGSGKHAVARAIHGLSPAAAGPFVIAEAAFAIQALRRGQGIPQATAEAKAVLDSVQGGTLYLTGTDELSLEGQEALLRLLPASEARNGLDGGDRHAAGQRCAARVLASSECDLRCFAATGQFRRDLYARLSAVEIYVPSLRQRAEDIPALAGWLLSRLAEQIRKPQKTFTAQALEELKQLHWRENLRELERVALRAAALADGGQIGPHHLSMALEASPASPPTEEIQSLDAVIQSHVLAVLVRCEGNKLRAAEALGISRSTLYRMLGTMPARSMVPAKPPGSQLVPGHGKPPRSEATQSEGGANATSVHGVSFRRGSR